jgi:hypothetical protein
MSPYVTESHRFCHASFKPQGYSNENIYEYDDKYLYKY